MSAAAQKRTIAHGVAPAALAGIRTSVWAGYSAMGPTKVQVDPARVHQPDSNPAKLSAMSDAPTQVAPGVHRLGNALVNFYVIEDGNALTLVDGGLPGFRSQLDAFLRERGRSIGDIAAVILTHGHSDHVGIVEGVRADASAPVHVHERDADMARTGKVHKRDGSMLPYMRHGAAWRLLIMGARNGGMKTTKVAEVSTFGAAGDLDVPGRPRVIPTPGHSPGHVAFHLPDRGVLIAGDALCTFNVLTGARGPQLMPKAFAADALQMLASLEAVERIDAGVTLFGHGEPWTQSPAEAVSRAREVGLT
jgi:glyoxylase-like metal-dependent hydrolase (beta-lactamase superfamily II)